MNEEQLAYYLPSKFQEYSNDFIKSIKGFIQYQELYDIEEEIEALSRIEDHLLKTRNELERLSKVYFSRLDSLRLRRDRSKYES